MNILVSCVADKDSDERYASLLGELSFDTCAVVFSDRDIYDNSIVAQKFATYAFFHGEGLWAEYSGHKELYDNSEPVDVNLLEELSPFLQQTIFMTERCLHREWVHKWYNYIESLRFWNGTIDALKIDVVINGNVGHEVYDYIIWCLCKKKGVKYIASNGMSFYNRTYILDDIYQHMPNLPSDMAQLREKYEDISCESIPLNDDMREMYEFYTNNENRTPFYMKNVKNANKEVAGALLRYFKQRSKVGLYCLLCCLSLSTETYEKFSSLFFGGNAFREPEIITKYYQINAKRVDYQKKYVYVALHMQPEMTSSPFGGWFVDQTLMIKMLSYWLPVGWVLYVKEHPNQLEQSQRFKISSNRTLEFYKTILRLKNVRLVSLEEDTYRLIAKAQAVATLTGTVGLEAITMGIPCLMFGYGYMQHAPLVHVIRNNSDCQKAIECIQKPVDKESNKKNIKLFFKAMEKYVFRALWETHLLSESEREESQKRIVKAYKDKLVELCGNAILKV